MPLLDMSGLRVSFDGIVAVDEAGFQVEKGQVCGLIGPNGAGKTTLFNCVSRVYTPRAGRIVFDGTDVLSMPPYRISSLGIARTFQNLGLFPSQSVLENVTTAPITARAPTFSPAHWACPSLGGKSARGARISCAGACGEPVPT